MACHLFSEGPACPWHIYVSCLIYQCMEINIVHAYIYIIIIGLKFRVDLE